MNIIIKQGETIKLTTTVLDSSGDDADLSSAIVKFAIKNKSSNTTIIKTPTVSGNVISLTLYSEDTRQIGNYVYEFRIKLNGEEDSIDDGTIRIEEALVYGL